MKRKSAEKQKSKTPIKNYDRTMKILAGAFIVSALVTGFLAFRLVRDIISTTDVFQLGGVSISDGGPGKPGSSNIGEEQISSGSITVDTPEIDFTSRINVLIMGLDYRDWEANEGPPRSDTMMLLTLDPVTKTAGMLSIPRDLWVNIPGFGQNKINTAYFLGEANRLPGGGPELASRTVEEFLGIDVHYWAQVDFTAFVQFIDYIGGVKIDIPEKIKLSLLGTTKNVVLQPGVQTLTGEIALAYARNRTEGDGDFSRAQRQQTVVLAIRNQLLRADIQKIFFGNPKGIWDIFSQNIHTNIPFVDAFNLGKLALQINPEQISQHVIAPPEYVTLETSPDGLSILKPITQNIRLLRDEIFSPSGIVGPGAVGADPSVLMQSEAARLGVYNGSTVSGLAGATDEYLRSLNVNVTDVGNADLVPATTIYDYTGKPYTVEYLVNLMGIQPTRIFNSYDPTSSVDVAIVLGDDWQVPTP
jgi:LCP family protein required for cell wall assembly